MAAQWVTVPEAIKQTPVPRATMYRWLAKHTIKHKYVIGTGILVNLNEVREAWSWRQRLAGK